MALSLSLANQQNNHKMKNIVKLSLLTVGIAFSSSLIAQEEIKKDAISTADKLEAPKPADTKTGKQEPVKADKQEPVKSAPKPSGGASKTESKSDTSSGTRMAITEQGMPKKNKRKAASSTTAPPATPPKK